MKLPTSSTAAVTPRPDSQRISTELFQNRGMFFIVQNRPANYHDLPRNDHNFTTKTPRKNTRFSETPLKNAHKTPKTTHSRRPQFFLK
jgi:hypothetical protein